MERPGLGEVVDLLSGFVKEERYSTRSGRGSKVRARANRRF